MQIGDTVLTPDGVTARVLEVDAAGEMALVDLGGPQGWYATAALTASGPVPAKEG